MPRHGLMMPGRPHYASCRATYQCCRQKHIRASISSGGLSAVIYVGGIALKTLGDGNPKDTGQAIVEYEGDSLRADYRKLE